MPLEGTRWHESRIDRALLSSRSTTPAIRTVAGISPDLRIAPGDPDAPFWLGWPGTPDILTRKAGALTASLATDVSTELHRVVLAMLAQTSDRRFAAVASRTDVNAPRREDGSMTMEIAVTDWTLRRAVDSTPLGAKMPPRIVIHGRAQVRESDRAEPSWATACEGQSDPPSDRNGWTHETPDAVVFAPLVATAIRRCAFQLLLALPSAPPTN